MSCWFNSDTITASQTLMFVGDKDADNRFYLMEAEGTQTGDPLRSVRLAAEGFDVNTRTSSGYSANTWHHALVVYASDSSNAIYIDGGSKGTSSNTMTPAGWDRTSLGRNGRASAVAYLSGHIAEAAIWDVALTDEEAVILGLGYSPLFVRPQSLADYRPLVRGINSKVNSITMTANGTVVSNHPRIFYPTSTKISYPAVAAPPVGIASRRLLIGHGA